MQSEPFKITATSHLHLRRVIRGGINRFLKILEFITLSEKHLCVSGTQTNARVLFPLWSHFSFHCVCLTLNLMSQSEPGWELITQAAHYSLPGIKYAACPWTWYTLSLFCVSLFLFPCLSFFSFFCLKVNILTSPLSRTPFHTSPDNFRNFPETGSLISTQKVSRRAAFELFSSSFLFFFCCQLLVYTTESPLPLSPVPSGLCIHTKRTGCLQSCYCRGEVSGLRGSADGGVSEAHFKLRGLRALSASVMYRGPSSFVTSIKKQHGC